MTKVYFVYDVDENTPYGIFSNWNRAYSFIREQLKKSDSPWVKSQLKKGRSYLHPYEIETFIIDERFGESHQL